MKKSVLLLILLVVLATACTQQTTTVKSSAVCGNNICEPSETFTCLADCPKIDTKDTNTLDWISQTQEDRNNQQTTTSNNQGPVGNPNPPKDGELVEGLGTTVVAKTPIDTVLPEIGFRVANRQNLLSINESADGITGTFTAAYLPQILQGGRLTSSYEAFGPRAAYYDQTLRLRSGRVIFGYEEDSEKISSYLTFKDGDPILEYNLRMNGGIFKFFEGAIIHFLGHDYAMTDVSDSSILLVGVDTQDSLILRNGHSAIIDGREFDPQQIKVNMTRDNLNVKIYATDDIKLLPGETLTSKLKDRITLLTNRIDVSYEGLTESKVTTMFLRRGAGDYKLTFTNNIGQEYIVPIARQNPVKPGNANFNFVYQEARNITNFNIKKNDYILINNRLEDGGISSLLKLDTINYVNKLVKLSDPASEGFYITYTGTPGQNAYADFSVYGINHRVYVGLNNTIAMDQNGDGVLNGRELPIVAVGNSMIRLQEGPNNVTLRHIILGKYRENSKNDLVTQIVIDNNGVSIPKNYLQMNYDPANDKLVGMNDFGTLYLIQRDIDSKIQQGADLIINQPLTQRFAEAILKAYE